MLYHSAFHRYTGYQHIVQILDIDAACYMFYRKMQISLPAYGSRPIRLLDIQIEIFAGHQGIQQNHGLAVTWPEAEACISEVGAKWHR